MLDRLARTCFRRRWLVLATWLVLLVGFSAAGSALSGEWAGQGRLPGTGSQRARDLLERELPQRSGESGTIVLADISADKAAADALLAEVAKLPGVVRVGGVEISPGGRVAAATVDFAPGAEDEVFATATRVADAATAARAGGLDVELSGDWFTEGGMPASEIFGILAAALILVVAFGSMVAAGVPIVTALVGVGIAMAGVSLGANVFSTAEFTPQVTAMIGVGVGIDYALFIVTRYRKALERGVGREDAVADAIGTAGRAVLFAGCTVIVSMLGMILMGLSFLHGLAVGASFGVLVSVAAAVTLVPAMLGLLGRRIDSLHLGRRRPVTTDGGVWWRWGRLVQRRPVPVALAGLALLLAAGAPLLGMRLGFADQGNDPTSSTTRRAHDLMVEGFGAGSVGPIVVALDTGRPGATAAVPALLDRLRATPGVVEVAEPLPSPSGAAAVAILTPATGPQDERTATLLRDLRQDVIPAALAGTALQVHLGGQTAAGIDFAEVISRRLPIFIGAVLALSFLLLLVVFRSVLVPLKAVLMNLLSIGAAYGVLVAVFQWGWAGELLGVSGRAPIEPWAPMMLFAIVFGLSMDYEVFLLSAVRESYDETGDNAGAVASGLAATGRVITAAAAIMVCVFASFVLSDVRELKLIGLGLAVAVAVDATIVRVVLVPATMELLGKANWWLPGWLDRLLPNVSVERLVPLPSAGEGPRSGLVGASR